MKVFLGGTCNGSTWRDELNWYKCKPVPGDENHWHASLEGWSFDIYKVGDTGIDYHLKVSVLEETISISWFNNLDDAKRSAERKNEFVERILPELFK